MKRNYSFFLGMLTMLIIVLMVLPLTTYAATNSIAATLSDMKIYINNKILNLQDENGNKLQPIIYNGRTYLPVRLISEAVNLPVTYVANTRSVYLGKNDLGIPSLYLTDLKYFYTTLEMTPLKLGTKDNLGNSYDVSKTLSMGWTDSKQTYNIDGKYSTLKGVCFLTDYDVNSTKPTYAKIYGDNDLIWSGTFSAGVKPIDFSLNITGYNQLSLEIIRTVETGPDSGLVAFANLGLYP